MYTSVVLLRSVLLFACALALQADSIPVLTWTGNPQASNNSPQFYTYSTATDQGFSLTALQSSVDSGNSIGYGLTSRTFEIVSAGDFDFSLSGDLVIGYAGFFISGSYSGNVQITGTGFSWGANFSENGTPTAVNSLFRQLSFSPHVSTVVSLEPGAYSLSTVMTGQTLGTFFTLDRSFEADLTLALTPHIEAVDPPAPVPEPQSIAGFLVLWIVGALEIRRRSGRRAD